MWSPGLLLVAVMAVSLLPPSGGFGNRRLCGIQLVEALLFVCGEKGLFYHPGRRLRQDTLRVMKNSAPYRPKEGKVRQRGLSAAPRLIKRGIVEQCCHFYCDYYDLENYCNT